MDLQFLLETGSLILAGFLAIVWSTVSGGGGSLLLIPALGSHFSSNLIAPVINLGSFIGRPARLIIFWKDINWSVTWYYVLPAWVAAIISGYLLSTLNLDWLKIIIGLFLISTFWQFRFGKIERSFDMKRIYFAPLGFLVVLISTLVGGVGPVNNPFYLNYGLDKESLIAT